MFFAFVFVQSKPLFNFAILFKCILISSMIHVYFGKIFDIQMNKEKRRAQDENAHQRPEPEARTQGQTPRQELKEPRKNGRVPIKRVQIAPP